MEPPHSVMELHRDIDNRVTCSISFRCNLKYSMGRGQSHHSILSGTNRVCVTTGV